MPQQTKEDILFTIALRDLKGLAEILEDLLLSSSRHDEIKDRLSTISHVIEKGSSACKTVEELQDKIRSKELGTKNLTS